MTIHNLATRATSLVLALELFFAPAAMARAADPLEVLRQDEPPADQTELEPDALLDDGFTLTPEEEFGSSDPEETPDETPADPEKTPEETPEENPAEDPATVPEAEGENTPSATRLSAASTRDVEDEDEYDSYYFAVLSPGIATSSNGTLADEELGEGRVNFELDSADRGSSWIYRDGTNKPLGMDDEGNYYLALPNVGRVPDKTFAGFYLLSTKPEGEWSASGASDLIRDWTVSDDDIFLSNGETCAEGIATCILTEAEIASYFEDDLPDADVTGETSSTFLKIPASFLENYKASYHKEVNDEREYIDYYLPIAAKWVASSDASVTDFALTTKDDENASTPVTEVYIQDPRNDSARNDHKLTLENGWWETNNKHKYYIMVNKDQTTLDLTLTTTEPHYNYNTTKAGNTPVSITGTFNGEPLNNLTVDGSVVTVQTTLSEEDKNLNNSASNPARGLWTISNIPLTSVTEAENKNDPYTTLTITVTSPDGNTSNTYTFHIERRTDPTASAENGNTPVGMILRDKTGNWGSDDTTIAANKAAAIAYFRTYQKFSTELPQPKDFGALYAGNYSTSAWEKVGNGAINYDLSETAVVAYLDTAFDDPGVSFVDSEGTPVLFGSTAPDAPYQTCVTRTIALRVADSLTPDLYNDSSAAQTVYYTVNSDGQREMSSEKGSQTLQNADGSDLVDLRGLNVLPGVYTMTYVFTDPTSGDQVTITRPLIILPIPGDVDMDGAVTIADAEQISAITNPLIVQRVCNIQRGDLSGSTAIRNGFQPVDGNTGKGVCDYFYPPLPANGLTTSVGSNYTQRTWSDLDSGVSTQADGEDASALELRFLGRDTGTMASAGYTSNISGPWNSPTEGEDANVTVGDIFWVGVYLTAGDLAGQKVQSLALNLTYDSYYVEPVAVYGYNEDGSYSTTQEKWSNLTLFRYNQGAGADENRSIFANTNAEQYSRAGSAMTRDYSQHYSKVVGTLAEKLSSDQRETRLKELCYNLYCLNTTSAVALKDGYLLVVPFRVIAQPANATQGTFVELSAGMRDITLVTTSTTARAASSQTMAFSAQDAIFGSSTANLRDEVALTASTAAVTIPLGEDTTTATVLKNSLPTEKDKNARYDVEFKAQIMDNPTEAEVAQINGILEPYGLSIQGGSGLITGTPTQATVTAAEKEKGIEFTVKDKVKYKIIIEKKDLPYAVTSVDSYYGETEFRGTHSDDLSFTVLASNLSQRDRDALNITSYDSKTTVSSKSLITTAQDGTSTAILPGYTVGSFTVRLSTETAADAVTATTPARDAAYPIITELDPVARDYNFIRQDGPATSGLTIHRRPIWIDTISLDYATYAKQTQDYTSAIYNTEGQKYQTFSLDEAANGSVSLTYNGKITGEKYDNLTLTVGTKKVGTDKLTLTFSGQYTFNQADNDYNNDSDNIDKTDKNWFHLSEPEESRPVTQISSIVLTGESAKNYKLVSDQCQNQSGCSVTGVVLRRGIVRIDIVQEPPALTTANGLTVGATITSDEALRVRVELSSETVGDYSYEYSGDDLAVWNLHYNWVTPEQKALGEATQEDDTHILVTQPDGTKKQVEVTSWSADANSITIKDKSEERIVNLTNWDPTIEGTSDEQDLLQYNGTTPVTADMDGMYICVVAKKFDSSTGDERYIKVYSEHSLKVNNRTLRLKPVSAARFYGEPNSAMTYTYSFDDLTIPDQTAMLAYIAKQGYTTPKGTQEELEGFLAHQYGDRFTAPTLTAATTKKSPGTLTEEEKVTPATSASGMDKYILLSGGSCPGYDLRYYRTTEKDYSADFGYAFLQINRRPIIVNEIFTTVKGENGSELTNQNFATIYADTYDLKLTYQTLGDEKISFSAASKSDTTKSEISFKLPVDENNNNAIKTYYNGSGQDITASNMTLTGAAIYEGGDDTNLDADNLTLSYNVTFVPDKDHKDWAGMATNYYSVEKLTEEGGTGTRPVEITDLTLSGSAAVNYMLVYEDTFHAERKAPAAAVSDNTHYNTTHPNTAHLIYGAGTVILRPIKSMELTGLGRMSYTYGETFALSQTGETGRRFKLTVSYDTYYGTNPPNVVSTTQEDVTYLTLSEDGTENSFASRGFTIYYCAPGSDDAAAIAAAQQEAIDNGQTLVDTAQLYPLTHSGAYLFVTGKRGEHDAMVSSSLSSIPLTVKKADLTLTGSAVHRFYGEKAKAEDLSFTFPLSQLAEWDLARLNAPQRAKTTGSADELQAALANGSDDGGYVAPSASQAAENTLQDASLNAYTSGNSAYASYVLPMTFPSEKTTVEYDNYVVTVDPGTLYVYPRPVFPDGIHTDQDHPIYTLYSNTDVTSYKTQLTTDTNQGKYVTMSNKKTYTQRLADDIYKSLPINGDPLYNSDQLSFNISLAFDLSKLNLSGNATDHTAEAVDATITSVVANETAKNYNLIGDKETQVKDCWGAVKLRSIGEIYIVNPPKMDYTYSEALDLTGLKVRIIYKNDAGETTRDETVTYAGPDQFKEYGLYVNYYDSATLTDADKADLKAIVTKYNEAREGDHITIASSHETSRYGSNFSANGKYLIVSAFQAGSDQPAATPKIIGAEKEGVYESYTKTPKQIQISPLTLTYDLSADSKTYDGTTRTDGALTLTNVYQDSNVTDAIYVPIGADYEREGTTNFTALTNKVTNGKITFQTKNQSGYQYGTHLTFNFVNPNVHYVDYDLLPALSNETYWRANQDFTSPTDSSKRWDSYPEISALPVEVTNMNLFGPDAANYTWSTTKNSSNVTVTQHKTTVELTTRDKTTAGQAAAPFATIKKAARSDVTTLVKNQALYASRRPALLLDAHSNALRFDFLPQSVLSETWWNNANENSTDDYQSELHFEYALFYFDEDGTLRRWALDDGTGDYQDTLFFGGETVIPTVDRDYVPDPDRLPKPDSGATTLTGQTYPWLAEDNGKSALGYEQGSGMTILDEAYPGGEAMAEHYSWYYYLLKTARTALPRNTVFYPVIRLAETHNYSASAPVTADDSITPEILEKVMKGNGTLTADDVSSMTSAAQQAAEEHTANEALMAEGKWPEEEPSLISARAVKTFTQRLDLTSVSTEHNKEGDTQTDHLVEMLEAVWFTDTQLFRESRELDGVVYNHPTRYYGYYWDKYLSTALKFEKETPIDLSSSFSVEYKDKEGKTQYLTVNQNQNLTLYVNTTANDGNTLRKITIVPSVLYARLGDAPFQLGLVTVPERPSDRRYTWTTSDSTVATVDENGLVTFRGVGECEITVTSKNNKTATVRVVVSAALALETYETPIFNFRYDQPWESLQEGGAFRGKDTLTRGQLALLLDKFLDPNGSWQATSELAYLDIREGDQYYDALRRLTGAGVVTGIPGGRFAPDQLATRAEFAAMLSRMLRLKLPTSVEVPTFTDVTDQLTWAWDHIEALARTGVTYGVGSGAFAPDRPLTREEAAVILSRLLVTKLDESRSDLTIPTDVTPENWSYSAVLRAVNAVLE